MDFFLQCQKAAAKATQALGVIKRTYKHLNKESFLLAYKSYIRPHLEYCVQLWNPYLIKDIDIIEKVQRRATKLVKNIATLPYDDRLRYLDLYSLYC